MRVLIVVALVAGGAWFNARLWARITEPNEMFVEQVAGSVDEVSVLPTDRGRSMWSVVLIVDGARFPITGDSPAMADVVATLKPGEQVNVRRTCRSTKTYDGTGWIRHHELGPPLVESIERVTVLAASASPASLASR